MTIRRKITYAICLASVLLILVTYLISQISFTPRFAELEKQHVARILLRFQDALADQQRNLDRVLNDWVNRDDTYRSVAKDIIDSTKIMTDATLTKLRLNFMIILDGTGRPLYETDRDFPTGQGSQHFNALHWINLPKGSGSRSGSFRSQTGIVLAADKPMALAIHPILPGDKQGTRHGTLIIGQFLDQKEIRKRIGVTSRPVEISWYSGKQTSLRTVRLHAHFYHYLHQSILIRISRHQISGYLRLRDPGGAPLFAGISLPRFIYQQGQQSIYYFLFAFAGVWILLVIVLFLLLDKTVLRRLSVLNQSINEIAASNDLSIRIPTPGEDELTNFSRVFNRMMTSLEQFHLELEVSHQKFADIIALLPDPTFVIDEQGKIVAWNRAIEEMTGVRQEEMIGRGEYAYAIPFYGEKRPLLINLVNSEDTTVRHYYERVEKKGSVLFAECEVKLPQFPNRLFLWVKAAPILNSNGESMGAIESIRDISGRKQAEEELKFLSLYDPLTGLYNRTFFEKEFQRFEAGLSLPVGVIMCDVDGLKLVNDSLGHSAGDQLLKKAGAVIGSAFRDHEVIARIGGDEFAVLLPQSDAFFLEQATRRIQEAVQEYNLTNPEMPLSISVGWAFRKDADLTLQEVLKEADNNMYREKLHRSESAHSAIVQTLMKTLGARDFITEGHADRLRTMVVDLAQRMGLSERKIHDISLLAQFHDIGKVGIPDNILFKPGPLDDDERNIMKRHSEIGYSIAQSAQELLHISEWILMHHERWDGSGYPCGRKGEEIPLECRILAIVDAYDAMTSDRPYRKALTHVEALAELQRCAGTQFDPELVREFTVIVSEFKREMP